jgi:Flp pilus assembly pilin Flp
MKLPKRISEFLCRDEALAATEYAVMTSAILGGVIVSMTMFGEAVRSMYVAVTGAF